MLKPVPWPCCARVGVPRNSVTASAKNETMIMRFIGTSQLIFNPKADCLTHSDDTARRSKVHVPKHVNLCRLIITKRLHFQTCATSNLHDLAKDFLDRYAKAHKRASSIRNDRQMLEKIVLPKIGSIRVRAVTRRDIETVHHGLKET